MRKTVRLLTAYFCIVASSAAHARDHIHVVGSSTVFPFITTAAEEFSQKTPFATPIVEQLGTGGGLKLFCNGLGATAPFDYPDIASASRRIKKTELKRCSNNGIKEILEIKIGYDGIVFANAVEGARFTLSTRQIYLALAATVPAKGGDSSLFIPNPYDRWNQISSDLPDQPIKVLGPPQTSGTRDALNTLAIEAGCRTFPAMKALESHDPARFAALCRTIRDDQRYIEAGENDNLIIQKMRADTQVLGILPFSFMEQNTDVIKAATINGFAAAPNTIRTQKYPVARSLYIYVKAAHARSVPGIEAFISELLSDEAMGDYGYLVDKGLITLPKAERVLYRRQVDALSITPPRGR